MRATAAIFWMTPERRGNGDGGFGGGGSGGPSGGGLRGPSGGGLGGFGGKWSLYDEKYVLSGKGAHNPKSPQTWLQDLHDYLAGRSPDLDPVLDWAEKHATYISLSRRRSRGSSGLSLAHWWPMVLATPARSSTMLGIKAWKPGGSKHYQSTKIRF